MVLFYLILTVLAYTIYIYSRRKHSFWAHQGVKGQAPLPLIGNYWKVLMFVNSESKLFQELHEKYPDEKVVGFYRGLKPSLLLRDLDLINQILIKDFAIFQDRDSIPAIPGLQKLGKNLVWAEGETWRVLRHKLSPLFTSKKLKDMVPLVQVCANNCTNYVEYLTENNIDHEIRSLMLKYNLQVTGSVNFGIHVDAFSDKEDQFRNMSTKIFNPSALAIVLLILNFVIPGIMKLDSTDLYGFFSGLASNVIKERENKPMERKDFVDLMIELRAQGKASRKTECGVLEVDMDDETIAAQAFAFFAAGFETTSGAMSFMIHELALHQDIQDKVYEEICKVTAKYDDKITYDAIKEMTYLEMVFYETLRKHSIAKSLARKALKDYTLPGVNVFIPKGTCVYISVFGIHYDKTYYKNPDKFDPEHFSPENKVKRPNCSFLAFGEGPRNCIGTRLALIQAFVGMAAFLKKFRVEPSSKTRTKMEYKTIGITSQSKHGIWVKMLKR